MRQKPARDPLQDELTMAIGLVWGHLNSQQPQAAYELASGCLQLWPADRSLNLMAAYASAELGEPVDLEALRSNVNPDPARAADQEAWIALVARRAGLAS